MIVQATNKIKNAKHLVVLTGAGISTESGLPDFRSNGGLWDGLKPEEISHASAVGTKAFLDFFTKRINDMDTHEPNIAHEIIAKWQENQNVTVITQNIDGYHTKAGAKGTIEMHGHLRYLECDVCGTAYDNSKYTSFSDNSCEMEDEEGLDCQGTVRPPVVLFGEMLPALEWHKAVMAMGSADVVLVLGTSLQVFPFNTLVQEAYDRGDGASIIFITKSETPLDKLATIRFHDGIGETLKAIDEKIN